MKKTYDQTIKGRLLDFQKEIKAVCKNCGRRAEEVKVVYATKYLSSQSTPGVDGIINRSGPTS